MKYTLIQASILLFCLLTSCEKELFESKEDKLRKEKITKIIGNYHCKVLDHYRIGSDITDTIYYNTLTVEQDLENILIFNGLFHIDSLIENETYKVDLPSSNQSYKTIKFANDSVFFFTQHGGLGGESSIDYKGKKI